MPSEAWPPSESWPLYVQTILSVLNHQTAQLNNLSRKVSGLMALDQDLKDTVDALVAEDGAVVAALDALKAKADAAGSVSNVDVQAAVDTVRGEITKLSDAVAKDNPPV